MNELEQAFGSLVIRSEATGSVALDRIMVRDYTLSVEIGAFQEERGQKQKLRFNIVLEVAQSDGGKTDDVDVIISYDTITGAINYELDAMRYDLLETLAENIAGRVLSHPMARRAFVRIEKMDRIPGSLGVEIERVKQTDLQQNHTNASKARVVFVPDYIDQDKIAPWVHAARMTGMPVIFIFDQGSFLPRAQSDVEHWNIWTERRIHLLAIEQRVWHMASGCRDLVAVASRTEMDALIEGGRIATWLPSKMVFDATHQPEDWSARGLAYWLANLLGGTQVIEIGQNNFDAPEDLASILP